jgi:MerR family transcriptional regulator, copper efflux regulator
VPAARSSPRTIGRAAREAGVHVETIRYYERLGLIARPRAVSKEAGSYRVYPDETVRRLQFVRNAQKLGFSLKEIAELAGMATTGVTCAEMCARMDVKLDDIDREIQRLAALRNELAQLLATSPRKGPYTNCNVCKDLALA